jgi:hypothetical protein
MSQHDPGPAGYQTPSPASPDEQPTSGMAVTALVLGIVSLPLACVGVGLITGIIALILGIIAMGKTGEPPYAMKGKGMAIAGLVLGIASVLIGPIALLTGILLPALGAARRSARQIQNSTQLRGIHQELVIAAQSQKGYYIGLDAQGMPVDLTVEGRFELLLNQSSLAPDQLINPADTGKVEFNFSGSMDASHYSYAMLEIAAPGGRRDEWRDTINTSAVVLSDRNTNPNGPAESVWSDQGWKGSVLYNDGMVSFESSEVIIDTKYGQNTVNSQDDLFNAQGPNDALMIHEGAQP